MEYFEIIINKELLCKSDFVIMYSDKVTSSHSGLLNNHYFIPCKYNNQYEIVLFIDLDYNIKTVNIDLVEEVSQMYELSYTVTDVDVDNIINYMWKAMELHEGTEVKSIINKMKLNLYFGDMRNANEQ